MKKNTMAVMATVFSVVFGMFMAKAETISVSGGNISYTGARASTLANGDVVLVFDNAKASNTFTIPDGMTAKTHLFLVGGGGAGGTVGMELDRGAAGGGGAGGISDRNVMLDAGVYTVTVGKGGEKAQTCVQSWVGDDGENSAISLNSADNYIASTKGGGGGGSVKIGGEGTPGASGGGGSWFAGFMLGGAGTEGYGWSGGTPTNENIGGGGGGSAKAGADGRGKADGTAGLGRVSDITGEEVEYARGGRGGRRGDSTYIPADASGYGCGGDGAVNGIGGKGADGVVIVRFSKVFEYKYVDFPAAPVYTNSFVWADGASYTAFDLSKATDEFRAAIATVEGVTNVSCSVTDGGAVTNGLGRYKFILYLNDEYKWNDGDTGSSAPYGCSWRVKEPDVIGDITVEVKKTVDWFEGTNATIAIDVHSTPEIRQKIPNVLFIGSLCSAHGYSLDVIHAAINAVTEVGNIDYRFYNAVDANPTPAYSGSVSKGTVFSDSMTLKSGNHSSMYGFYKSLVEAIDSGKEYDYIIFSFDRTLTATQFNAADSRESEVVNWLKPFYQKNAVIWLVDNSPENDTTHNIAQTPWYPSQLVCITTGSGRNETQTWQSLYYYYYNYVVTSGNNRANTARDRSYRAWKAMMGLFDPVNYSNCSSTTYNSNYTFDNQNNSNIRTRVRNLSGSAIKNQVVYNNAENVANVIKDVVKPTIATLQLEDHVYLTNGLKIAATEGYWTTNEGQKADSWSTAKTDWTKLKPNELTSSDADGVRIAISNVTTDVWLKLKVGVYDTGRFLSSVNATYNEQTGQWEKDPNDGPVTVKMTPDAGTEILAEDQASTTVEWSFEAYKITGGVVWGEGDFIINGFYTNLISVAKGYNPEVLFRGAPGWAVNYIEVDGVVLDEVNYKTNWFFGAISADHDLRVGFTNIVVNPPPPEIGPATNVYDGTGYAPITTVPPTFAEGYEEYSNHWYMVYSTDPDADPNDRSAWSRDGVITNVVVDANGVPQPQTVYARVCLDQPGYEDGAVVPYWIGTNTVTMLPREIEVTFNDYIQDASHGEKTSGFSYRQTGGELVPGDTIDYNAGKVVNRPNTPDATPGTITANGTMTVSTPDAGNSNYIVHVVDGKYYYPNTQLVAEAPNIVKYYDALTTGSVVKVLFPSDARTVAQTTSDWSSWSNYTYNNNNSSWATRREHTRTRTITGSTLTIVYTYNGQNSSVPFEFTDVGTYEVGYTVNYLTVNKVETETGIGTRNNWWNSWGADATSTSITSDTGITYHQATGTFTVTIKPREVTVTADSAEKIFDGTALTKETYVIDPAETVAKGDQSGKGFIVGEGFASVPMTAGSTITLPGTVANTIDEANVALNSSTKAGNYDISYEPGTLKVTVNKLSADAANIVKTYDQLGANLSPSGITVLDKNGQPLDSSKFTITYARNPWDTFTSDLSSLVVTNAGEYTVFYVVDGGAGYGLVTNHMTITVNPIEIVLTAADASKEYDGEALTSDGFTVTSGEFLPGEGMKSVTMTGESSQMRPGQTANEIASWTFQDGTAAQNYHVTTVDGTLTVTRKTRYEVTGDGEFSWTLDTEDYEGKLTNTVTVVVDGKYTNQIYRLDSEVTDRIIHVTDEPGHDGATHVIEFFFSDEFDQSVFVDDAHWEPSADEDEVMYLVINTDPPHEDVEEIKKYIDVVNGPESGWMPLYTTNSENEVEVALRSPDGTEPEGGDLDSEFALGVTGSGEITVSRIIVPVDDEANIDDGHLTIWVDDREYQIPPVPDDTVSYSIVTNGHDIIISNLVIQVTGDSTNEHSVVFQYEREASNVTNNTAAIVEKIIWRTYGETDDGGSSWLDEGHALMIVDHEPLTNGWVYLAFKPQLKVEDEFWHWYDRTASNNLFRVRYGATRAECDACPSIQAFPSDIHVVKPKKVWIRVHLENEEEISHSYWRIFVGGKAQDYQYADDPKPSLKGPTKAAAPEVDANGETGADSINVFGILKIESSYTNTMIAVPWTWYSEREKNAEDIPARKLVKATNLTEGDMLYGYIDDLTYVAWMLIDGEWQPASTIVVKDVGVGEMKYRADDEDLDEDDYTNSTRAPRGIGLWLTRQKPLDGDGNIIPFWVYGQSVTNEAESIITSVTETNATKYTTGMSTMLGNPYAQKVVINDLVFEGEIHPEDTIRIPNGTATPLVVHYDATKKQWWYSTAVKTTLGKRTVISSKTMYNAEVAPGLAFWYVRMGEGELKIKWKRPAE